MSLNTHYNFQGNDFKNISLLNLFREEMYWKIFWEEHMDYANQFIQIYESNPSLFSKKHWEYYKNLKEAYEYMLKQKSKLLKLEYAFEQYKKKVTCILKVANNINYEPRSDK